MKSLLSNQQNNNVTLPESFRLQQQFYKSGGAWFINAGDQPVGPFSDKADAQMALVYHSVRAFWPNAKQLREFARTGK